VRVKCSKCDTPFESLIIDRDIAWKEILTKSSNHIKFKHPAMFQEMSQTIAITITHLTTFMHMNEFVIVGEEETEIQERLEKCREVVMGAIGYDPMDDDIEFDEEFLEDDDESAEEMPVGDIELPEGVKNIQTRISDTAKTEAD
jgi:hypothetical protein